MRRALVGPYGVAACSATKRAEKVVFGCLEGHSRCREQRKPLRMRGTLESGGIVAGKKTRLQLADPIHAFGILQIRIAGESLLGCRLLELLMIETSESPAHSTQYPYQTELRLNPRDGQTEPRVQCDFPVTLGDAFDLGQVIARGQHVRVDMAPGAGRSHDIANAFGFLDGPTEHITTGPE